MSPDGVPFLLLCGASGVGKSAVGFEIFDQLRLGGLMTARVDLDEIGTCYPLRDGDPENHLLKARNLQVMWRNFEDVGARCLVASGTVENRDILAAYKEAMTGAALTLCRLRVRREEQRNRMLHRGKLLGLGGPAAVTTMTAERLETMIANAIAEADELDRDEIADFCVDTDGLDVPTVARLVIAQAGGWPHISEPPAQREDVATQGSRA